MAISLAAHYAGIPVSDCVPIESAVERNLELGDFSTKCDRAIAFGAVWKKPFKRGAFAPKSFYCRLLCRIWARLWATNCGFENSKIKLFVSKESQCGDLGSFENATRKNLDPSGTFC